MNPKRTSKDLAAHLAERFRKEGLALPKTFSDEIALAVEAATQTEIEKALIRELGSVKAPP
jgi:hypothetical protein